MPIRARSGYFNFIIMYKILQFFLLFLFPFLLAAQKYDNIWISGYSGSDMPEPPNGWNWFSFEENGEWSVEYNTEIGVHMVRANLSMSDYDGNLIFYSNGRSIYNSAYEIMEGGEVINPGEIRESFSAYYPRNQNLFCLPNPDGNPDSYYLFHYGLVPPYEESGYRIDKIYVTEIDMSENDGSGKAVNANTILTEGSFDIFAATRHGNGRDWWIIIPDMFESAFHRFLVSPAGISERETQYIAKIPLKDKAQKRFSRDGSMYATFDSFHGLGIYNFDRCTGLLSNPRLVDYSQQEQLYHGGGLDISPNNRFLYVTYYNVLYQYDLWEEDLANSYTVITPPEAETLGGTYHTQYGPDGRLYISTASHFSDFETGRAYHIIDRPDEKGAACNLLFNEAQLFTFINSGLAYFPNYRLYDLHDSPCDTLGIDGAPPPPVSVKEETVTAEGFTVVPNPAADAITIQLTDETATGRQVNVFLLNHLGQTVKQLTVNAGQNLHLNVSDTAPGTYYLQLQTAAQTYPAQKLVIIK